LAGPLVKQHVSASAAAKLRQYQQVARAFVDFFPRQEQYGGRIWLERSEFGKGSTFSFSVPAGDGRT
jgi:hypothetical protein